METKKKKEKNIIFSIDGFADGRTSAGALTNDGIVERNPFAESWRIPILAMPT